MLSAKQIGIILAALLVGLDFAAAFAQSEPATQPAAGQYGRQVRMLVTAYCPCPKCCGPNARGITASGRPVTANGGKFCAAPRSIPFGTRLIVPGYNDDQPIPVYDRGGAIKGNHLDVFFPTHQEAREWGVHWIAVTILDDQPTTNPSNGG